MAYDPMTRKLVLFGGETYSDQTGGGSVVNDTWTFDGTAWAKLETASAPPPRVGGAMVFDNALGDVVLFGGSSIDPETPGADPTVLDDMWTFDGSRWTQLHPSSPPSGRFFAQMTYNSTTQQIVLFGGALNTSSDANDTWTFGTH
jgi:N-acetylneuraminic acid mutarotase